MARRTKYKYAGREEKKQMPNKLASIHDDDAVTITTTLPVLLPLLLSL
jgi:hypothetical protein